MTLEVDVEYRTGEFALAATFAGEAGVTALFGRSGAGKSTLVSLIAGLQSPARGRIAIDGEPLFDSARAINVPPHRRRVAVVFQEGRLFPHLTVRQNLLYGRWFTRRADRYGTLDQIVDLLGIASLLERRPAGLSGGEKQRVAIGRALLASPRLLLMDEPLASLDHTRRAEILPFIERLRDELRLPIVYVSHATDEVLRLARTVVVLAAGRVVAAGPIESVLGRPDLLGALDGFETGAVLAARVAEHRSAYGLTILAHPSGALRLPLIEAAPGSIVRLRILARDVSLATSRPDGLSIRNVLAGTIVSIGDGAAAVVDVALDLHGDRLTARITREAVDALALAPGQRVFALVKAVSFEPRPEP